MKQLIIFCIVITCITFTQNNISLKPNNYVGIYVLKQNIAKEFPSFNQFFINRAQNINRFSDLKMVVVFWPDTIPVKGDSMRLCWLKSFVFTKDSVKFNTKQFLDSRYEFVGSFDKPLFPQAGVVPLLQGELRYFKGKRLVKKANVQFEWLGGC